MDGVAALAFSAGALSVANPCALAMVPAYVALRAQTAGRSDVSMFVTTGVLGLLLGFVGVFTVVGLVLSLAGRTLFQFVPFVAGAAGIALVWVGVRTLLGRPLHFALPAVEIRGGPESLAGQVIFGATYGIASLGCALPVFLAYTLSFAGAGPLEFAVNLVAFSAGAASTLLVVVGVALAAQGARGWLPGSREIARYGGGALVTAAGLYVAYLQLGGLVGYPLGAPALALPL